MSMRRASSDTPDDGGLIDALLGAQALLREASALTDVSADAGAEPPPGGANSTFVEFLLGLAALAGTVESCVERWAAVPEPPSAPPGQCAIPLREILR